MIRNVFFQVISIYMGTAVNLAEWWDTYKAAKAALANTLTPANIRAVSTKNGEQLQVSEVLGQFSNLRLNKAPASCTCML